MSDELTAVDESVTKVLLDLMTERFMSERGMTIGEESSTRGVQASPSTTQVGTSQASMKRITKHKDDIANV
jgi:hypothetical protein